MCQKSYKSCEDWIRIRPQNEKSNNNIYFFIWANRWYDPFETSPTYILYAISDDIFPFFRLIALRTISIIFRDWTTGWFLRSSEISLRSGTKAVTWYIPKHSWVLILIWKYKNSAYIQNLSKFQTPKKNVLFFKYGIFHLFYKKKLTNINNSSIIRVLLYNSYIKNG